MKKSLLLTGLRRGGIAYAVARRFAIQNDWTVFACDCDSEGGWEAADEICADGGDLRFVVADISDPGEVKKVVDFVASKSDGALSALINNAGHASDPARDNLLDLTYNEFVGLLNNNLTSAFLMTQEVVKRHFIPQGFGNCVFVSTNNGAIGSLGQLGYGCAKQSLVAMCRILAAEFAGKNIRFNVISPGVIATDSPNWIRRRQIDPEWEAVEGGMNPTRRVGSPVDVACLVDFLVSDESNFINAGEFVVDGGLRGTGVLFPGVNSTNARRSYVETAKLIVGKNLKRVA